LQNRKNYCKSNNVEPRISPELINVDIQGDKQSFPAILDTGSAHSFISRKCQLTISTEPKKSILNYISLADESQVKVGSMINTDINFANDKYQTKFKAELNILNKMTTDVILGNDFMNLNDVVINYKKCIITIGKVKLEFNIEKREKWLENY
jgi:hypothetical protein